MNEHKHNQYSRAVQLSILKVLEATAKRDLENIQAQIIELQETTSRESVRRY